LLLGFWGCQAEISTGFGTQAVEHSSQCSPQNLSVDAFAACNLRQGKSVNPERAEPTAMVRLQSVQHLDQPFVLWISRLASVILQTIDPGLWFNSPIADGALMMQ
tara:strand:- start:670 stop:984 length:315 start_codon:yes stop_codon:yes gene_type:complete